MKRLLAFLFALTLLLTGCGFSAPAKMPDASLPAETDAPLSPGNSTGEECPLLEYSNLNSAASRQQVDDLLEKAGISAQRRQVLWNHVEQFNAAVDATPLLGDFQQANILVPGYDPYDYQEQWLEQYPDFNGYNCRITAFGLVGDRLSANPDAEIRDNDLFMDLESLQSDPSALCDDGDLELFRRVFSCVPTDNTTDVAVHAANVRVDWEKRGISFAESDSLSLITVWFHNQWSEEENELFIGHTGVLVSAQDGLYFVEKLAFQAPYQVIKLPSREMLKHYLMDQYDTAWGQNTASPFVMENDHLMTENTF